MTFYRPLPIPADCSVVTIKAALEMLGEQAAHVSSDVWVSRAWPDVDKEALAEALIKEGCLANRVRTDRHLDPHEWYVECCGDCVGSNPLS